MRKRVLVIENELLCIYFLHSHSNHNNNFLYRKNYKSAKIFFILRHLPPQKKTSQVSGGIPGHILGAITHYFPNQIPRFAPGQNLCLDVNQDPNGNWQQFEQAVSINEKQAKGNHKIKMVAILEVNCYRMLNCAESVVTSSFKIMGAQLRSSEISARIRS